MDLNVVNIGYPRAGAGAGERYRSDAFDKFNYVLNGQTLGLNITMDNDSKFKHNKLELLDQFGTIELE